MTIRIIYFAIICILFFFTNTDNIYSFTQLSYPTIMGKEITAAEAASLIKKNKAHLCPIKWNKALKALKVYILKNANKIVFYPNGKIYFYTFYEINVIYDKPLIDQANEGFLFKVDTYSKQLIHLLDLDSTQLDGSMKSLELIDSTFRKNDINTYYEWEILFPLTAYCGKIILKEKGGRWEVVRKQADMEGYNQESDGRYLNLGPDMFQAEDGLYYTVDIFIRGKDGKIYDIYQRLIEQLNTSFYSFRGTVEYLLNPIAFKLVGE